MIAKRLKHADEIRVLIVEDESRLRDLLESSIRDMGYAADGAPTAEAALRQMERCAYDIAVLDLNLPGITGLECCNRLHEQWPDTRVIILTGYGDLDAARTAIRLDVVDFLTKPASLKDLELALDRARRRLTCAVPEVKHATDDADLDLGAAMKGKTKTLQDAERAHIIAALERNAGNRSATATELGISVRTLYYRLSEYQDERGERDQG